MPALADYWQQYKSGMGEVVDPRSFALNELPQSGTSQGVAQFGANWLPFPAGDLVGALQDAEMYYTDPESRRWYNYLLSAAGVLPFVPSAAQGGRKLTNWAMDLANKDVPLTHRLDVLPDDLPRVEFPAEQAPKKIKAKSAKEAAKFPGAPTHIRSRQAEVDAINSYLDRVDYGAPAADWYKDESARILAAAGGRTGIADRFTGALQQTSANTQLEPNFMGGVRGYNQGMAGHPIKTHMGINNQRIQEIFDGVLSRAGNKVGPYGEHLRSAYDTGGTRAVHDVWDMRAWGYPDGFSPGEASHRWMDKVTEEAVELANARRVGGRADWDVDSLQAAAWTAMKADELGVSSAELAHGYQPYVGRMTAWGSAETVPSSELVNPVAEMPVSDKARFHRLMESVFTTPEGQDSLAQQVGLLTPEPGKYVHGGVWKNETNPVTRVPMLSGIADSKSQEMDAASRQLIEGWAAGRGLLTGQAGVGYELVRRPGSLAQKDANTWTILSDEMFSNEDVVEAQKMLDETFGAGKAYVSPAEQGRGLNLVWVGANTDDWKRTVGPTGFKSQGLKTIGELFPGGQFGKNSGRLVGTFEGYKPSAYVKKIRELSPLIQARIEAALPEYARRIEVVLRETGGQWDKKLTLTLEALRTGGLPAVEDLVKRGIVPATVLSIASSVLRETSMQRQSPLATVQDDEA